MSGNEHVISIPADFVEQTSQHLAAQRYHGGIPEGAFSVSVVSAGGDVLETTAVVLPDTLVKPATSSVESAQPVVSTEDSTDETTAKKARTRKGA